MRIRNVDHSDVCEALRTVNEVFDSNIEFKRFDRDGGNAFLVTLKAIDCRAPGARRGFVRRNDGERRRSVAACWHAHGIFMDSLPWEARIRSLGRTISPGDSWADWRAGSLADPVYMSELCDC